MNLLSTQQLNIQIGSIQVCKQLKLNCNAGEVWGIIGRNGIGKTTLLHTLAGLRTTESGNVFLQQHDITTLERKQVAQQLGILLQQQQDSFPSSVLETVLSGRHPHLGRWQWENKNDVDIALQSLQKVHLEHLAQRPINQLSGGERQRVAIATLITQQTPIMLLDEPNSHLDIKYQIQILDSLTREAKEQQKLLIMTLHDLNLVSRYCNNLIMLLGEGEVLAGSTTDLLTEENLLRLFDHPIHKHISQQHSFFTVG